MRRFVIYTINLNDDVMYVGCTCDFMKRKSAHKKLRRTIPTDVDLSLITFNIIAEFDNKEDALLAEDENIIKYGTLAKWNKNRSGLVRNSTDYHKKRYEEKKEHILEMNRRYKEEHKEYCKAYKKEYRETHKEKYAEYQRRYRNKKV